MFQTILFSFSVLSFIERYGVNSCDGNRNPSCHLFQNYDPGVLPTQRNFEPIRTIVKLYLMTVYNLNIKNQKLSSKVHISVSWKDDFLKWNETSYNGLNCLTIPLSEIWKPDIIWINMMEDKKLFQSEDRVLLQSNGIVTWNRECNIDTYCRIDTTFYPFDRQSCDIVFSKQYISDLYQYLWHNISNNITEHYVSNGEWNIQNIQRLNNTKCCDLGMLTDIIFRVDLERKTEYYYWIYIVPMISLAIVDVLTFCLPVKSQEKLHICLFVFLSLVYLVTVVNQSMPSTSDYISKFGTLLWTYIMISVLIILKNIIITAMVHRKWPKFISTIFRKCSSYKYDSSAKTKNPGHDINPNDPQPIGENDPSVSPQDISIQTDQNIEAKTETSKENLHFVATIMDLISLFMFSFAFFVCYWILLGQHIPKNA